MSTFRNGNSRSPIHQSETDTYLIPLTKGYFAVIDACDIDLANFKWGARISGRTVYAARTYRDIDRRIVGESLHRVILGRKLERILTSREWTDHIDHNGLNCRRDNLRPATPSQNAANRQLSKRNSSGYKGVTFDNNQQKWAVQIVDNGVNRHGGYYDDPQEAHLEYIRLAKKIYGEYACSGE